MRLVEMTDLLIVLPKMPTDKTVDLILGKEAPLNQSGLPLLDLVLVNGMTQVL
jgi:hypothetical protein